MPSQSNRNGWGGGRSQGIFQAISHTANGPTNSIDQNTQRHENASVITPPSGAPINPDNANTPPNNPMYFPRSDGAYRSPTTEKVDIIRIPAPMPWTARKAINS